MHIEVEAKFLAFDTNKLQDSLEEDGWKRIKNKQKMRRSTFDIPESPRGTFLRVRDEGDKVTLTYKQVSSLDATGTKEIEVVVDDFDLTCALLQASSMIQATYEENIRTEYVKNSSSITMDEWPGIPPFVEIEAADVEELNSVAKKYGFEIESAIYGSVDEVYKEYNIDLKSFSTITFENSPIAK